MFVTILEGIAQNQKSVSENEKIKYLGLTIQDILNMYNNYLKWRDGWAKQKENKYYGWILKGVSRVSHFIGQSVQFYNNICI
ncbi:hypothetical protein [Psychroserpens luteus]|uniref:Uncharacterized protein n=1 Tax=Psychroserpens luteus TaxID=1434066 RepID=A0ABW5ZTL3_9FLAO|nr:hypothetical protein [Psychroserpens luteus]